MHWTAFLAYRRFPAHARVIDDCACIQCGYNLRMQMVSSRCPECGNEVGNSVFLLARPTVAARGLRTAGVTYFAAVAIPLVMTFGAAWSFFVASLIAAATATFRIIGVSDLRFNAALTRLPIIGSRLNAWWSCTMAELAIGWAWLITMLATSGNRNLWNSGLAPRLITTCVWAWLIISVFSAVLAGRFGGALMDMLNYGWTRAVFSFQLAITWMMLVVTLLLAALYMFASLPSTAFALLAFTQVFLMILMLLVTGVPLLQAATACEQCTEHWEELLEDQRIALVNEAQMPRRPEPPPIPVDG